MNPDFEQTFREFTGSPPLRWQKRLFHIFRDKPLAGWPTQIDLHTGLGKTSVIHLWLIALAQQIQSGTVTLPRRLIYVVNRRSVVDQATEIATQIKEKPPLKGFDKDWFTISTLRGQFADNGQWSANPARPAVIVGTVDMIGSRLLFSGYGRGFKHRPLHAGFLAQDALLIHDEAHLEPAFQKLLEAIKDEQDKCAFRPFYVLSLSATKRYADGPPKETRPFTLTNEDYSDVIVKRRFEAPKSIALHPIEDEKKIAEQIAALAIKRSQENTASAILIFARRVEDVKKIVDALSKAKARKIEPLTGTLRGKERAAIVGTDVFKRFLPLPHRTASSESVFLVCTSAGEVGVDISADHMICDLSPIDSMTQRFGRVNRYGDGNAKIDVVHPQKFSDGDYDKSCRYTFQLIERLNGDGSPKALGTLVESLSPAERKAAFSPCPQILHASESLLDTWALTTICKSLTEIEPFPGRPPVADWLHGVKTWERPETYVAWRKEVSWITGRLFDTYDPEEMLDVYPLKPHELLRDQSERVFDELKKIAKCLEENPINVWIQSDRGVRPIRLADLIQLGEEAIQDCTVILPPTAGGLKSGHLDGGAPFDPKMAENYDVADEWLISSDRKGATPGRNRNTWGGKTPDNMRQIFKIDFRSSDDDFLFEDPELTKQNHPDVNEIPGITQPKEPVWRWYELQENEDSEASTSARYPVDWLVHTQDVEKNMKQTVVGLDLPAELNTALRVAARLHDLGKKRKIFQHMLGNPDPSKPWAKSDGRGRRSDLKYRHELGSLLDLESHNEFKPLADDMKDLVRHLIATHHGRARPHFPPKESFDPNYSDAQVHAALAQIPLRFARLQKRYGRWGLAYLESLLRAADCAASAHPSAYIEELDEVQA